MNYKVSIITCYIACLLLCIGCTTGKSNIEGIYVSKNYNTNVDSIFIMPNGIYKRIIYNNNRELIFQNKGTYRKYESYISFDDFLLNSNNLNIKSNYNSDDLMNVSLNIENSLFENLKLIENYDLNYYYLKVN